MKATSPLNFNRYELKYHIPESLVEPISRFAEIYCVLDPYSEKSPDLYYGINSLYFDSPNYEFLKRRLAGVEGRYNMRVRSYGDSPKPPYFLEVKTKTRGFVSKTRGKVFSENWKELIETHDMSLLEDEGIISDSNAAKFIMLAQSHIATPKVLTQYRRKAYLSLVDDYARITFDKSLRYMPTSEYNLHPDDKLMVNYDFQTQFEDDCNVILELKCNSRVPFWFLDLIKTFNLQRSSFSKYASSITETIMQDQEPFFDRAPAIF